MRCISVYTSNFEIFSDLFEKIMSLPLGEDEETVLEGVTVSESGSAPEHYLNRMKTKPGVVVMKVREKDKQITILQHGDVFEILIPETENMVH